MMSNEEKHRMKQGQVYYDGDCPMCTAFVGKLDATFKKRNVRAVDVNTGELPKGIEKRDALQEIFVVEEDGSRYRNAEAILRILALNPKLKFLPKLGRLPGVKQLLPIGYNFIARNRLFIFGPASRIYWVKWVLGFGFLAGIALSLPLWLSSRLYPTTPAVHFLPSIPNILGYGLLALLVGSLLGIILSSKPRKYIVSAIFLYGLFVLFDQSRLQPWAYQYAVMFAVLGFFSWKASDLQLKETILNICRFIVAAIYFWSGLQKFNLMFFSSVFPWFVSPVASFFPGTTEFYVYAIGIFIPLIEMAIGVGLLTRRFKTLAIFMALDMMVFVLLLLGPLGHNWNSVVWPWNVVMFLLVLVLFYKTNDFSWDFARKGKHVLLTFSIGLLFVFLPVLSFFDRYDSYPSFALYSGNIDQGFIRLSGATVEKLPGEVRQYAVPIGDHYRLYISKWSYGVMNVPAYPEERIYKNVAESLCIYEMNTAGMWLVIKEFPSFHERTEKTFTCSELRSS